MLPTNHSILMHVLKQGSNVMQYSNDSNLEIWTVFDVFFFGVQPFVIGLDPRCFKTLRANDQTPNQGAV